jgi:phage tail sheath protein FI
MSATATAAFLGIAASGPVDTPLAIASVTDFERSFGSANASLLGALVSDFFVNGGTSAVVVRLAKADSVGNETSRNGVYALAKAPNIGIAHVADATPDQAFALVTACTARSAMAILDAPFTWPNANATAARVATSDAVAQSLFGQPFSTVAALLRNAAAYTPRIGLTAQSGFRSPCGAVAGVWARTDASRGVWKAPAGAQAALAGVGALERTIDDAAESALEELGINSLRNFSGKPLVWGARTLDPRSDGGTWTYVSVRRTAIAIETSIARGLAFAAFEANDATLWARARISIEEFLQGLYHSGAFAGTTPAQAYFVRCDATTTTATDIAAGRFNVLVGFAPLRAAEFVVLSIAGLAARP